MSARWIVLWVAGLAVPVVWAAEDPKPQVKPASLAAQIAAIKKENQEEQKKFHEALSAAKDK